MWDSASACTVSTSTRLQLHIRLTLFVSPLVQPTFKEYYLAYKELCPSKQNININKQYPVGNKGQWEGNIPLFEGCKENLLTVKTKHLPSFKSLNCVWFPASKNLFLNYKEATKHHIFPLQPPPSKTHKMVINKQPLVFRHSFRSHKEKIKVKWKSKSINKWEIGCPGRKQTRSW